MPAFGSPAQAASAISLRCSSSSHDSPGQPRLGVPRRLPRRRREVRVAAPAAAAARDDDPRAVLAQVGDDRAVLGVGDLRADGHGEHDVVAVGAVLARAAAVAAAPGVEDRLGPERRQVAQVGVGDEHDVAAAAAVAAVRARPSARTSRAGS